MRKRKIINTIYIICVIVLIWVAASFVDVVAHNGNKNPKYASWNVFTWIN